MNLYALLLVVAAALLHAAWNLVTKQVNGKLPFFWLVALFSAVLYLPFVVMDAVKTHLVWTWLVAGFALVSALLHLFYFVVLQIGYRKADLSVVYPVARGAGPLFSVTGAIMLFHEKPGLLAVTGVGLIVGGVVVMTGFRPGKNTAIVKGLQYGLLTGLFIAAYTLWDKAAVVDHSVSAMAITFASMLLPLILLLPVVAKKKEETKMEIRLHWKQALLVAIFQPLSYLLVLIALKHAPVTYVAPVRELSIVFGVSFGASLLKEADITRRIIAALVIMTGIALPALG